MSKEIKIGILAIVAIALSFWGYKFIIGKNILSQSNYYKSYYDNANRIQVGTEVIISGFKVGIVSDIHLLQDQRVEVTLDLRKDIRIPKSADAVIISTSPMGGKAVDLQYDKPCSGDDCAVSGDTLNGKLLGLVTSMLRTDDLEAYVDIIKEGLTGLVDSLTARMGEGDDSPLGKSMADFQKTLANLNAATGKLDRVIASSSSDITGTLAHLEAVTGSLDNNKDKIENILSNADKLSSDLAEADLKGTLAETKAAIENLKNTLKSTDTAVAGVTDLIDEVKGGQGSLGKMLKDKELYDNLSRLSSQADSLMNDIQSRPYRYMPLKSRRKVKKFDKKDKIGDDR